MYHSKTKKKTKMLKPTKKKIRFVIDRLENTNLMIFFFFVCLFRGCVYFFVFFVYGSFESRGGLENSSQ